MLRRIVRFFAATPAMTIALWALLVGFGGLAYSSLMPREGFPAVEVPIAIFAGNYLVDDPAVVDAEVVAPMVAELESASGIAGTRTYAGPNNFTVVVELESDLAADDGAALLEAAEQAAVLPESIFSTIFVVDASSFFNQFDMLVAVYGPEGATAEEIESAAGELLPTFVDDPAFDDAELIELIRRGTNPQTGEELATQTGFTQVTTGAGANELRPAVAIGLTAADGLDVIEARDAADATLSTALRDDILADDYGAFVAADFATQIRQQIGSLQSNVLTGLIAVAAIALLLISWRASVIAAVFIATVLATTMGLLYLVGISLNTISLFGVILALGLFVDDAIVITEAIEAFRDDDDGPLTTIDRAIKRVGSASVSGTITTVLVFAPMLAISGILGDFIKILPISVMIALTVSLVLSLIFIPLAARYLILSAPAKLGPLGGIEERLSKSVAALPSHRGAKGILMAVLGVGLAVGMTAVGLMVFAPRVGFDIFPPQKDSTEINATYQFEAGTTTEDAEAMTTRINRDVIDLLGEDLESVYTYLGDADSVTTGFTLTPIGGRTTAPELIEDVLAPYGESIDDAFVNFSQVSAGPPAALFPFQAQIFSEDDEVLASSATAFTEALTGATIDRPNGTTFDVIDTDVENLNSIARTDGRRYIEVLARFDADDTTTITSETRTFLEGRFGAAELEPLGLVPDDVSYDLGIESDNQESFASMPRAFLIALAAMLILLIIQFRSTVQWFLVFLAIPFSLFGVFGGLLITNNEISFFVMLGLLGLIGIAVNNTILLVDFANQERRAGADRKEAISTALHRRFRPLVATSLTTVAGVLPLALSDPFWEALGYTIIFGLLSSTFLVLVAFPYFYLGLEWLRERVVTPWRPKNL